MQEIAKLGALFGVVGAAMMGLLRRDPIGGAMAGGILFLMFVAIGVLAIVLDNRRRR